MKLERKEKPNISLGPTSGFEKNKFERETTVEIGQAKTLLPETLAFIQNHIDFIDFNPEYELAEIRWFVKRLPPELQSKQRRALIQDFKNKLKATREVMATAQIKMEKILRANPDLSGGELREELGAFSTEIPSSAHYHLIAGIRKYVETRDAVKSVIEKYRSSSEKDSPNREWQTELFKDLFGKYPNGKIDIEITLAGLYFRIYDIEDYVTAHLSSNNPANRNDQEKIARTSGGARLDRSFANVPELSGKITIENSSDATNKERAETVKLHEEEHSIHFNFYSSKLFTERWFKFENIQMSEEEFEKELKKYAKGIVYSWLGHAKSEIMAYLKDGHRINHIRYILLQEGGLYDYLKNHQTDKQAKTILLEAIRTDNVQVKKNNLTILSEEEMGILITNAVVDAWNRIYRKTLETAFDAVLSLMDKYGHDQEGKLRVIRLLAQEPLEKWHRLVQILS